MKLEGYDSDSGNEDYKAVKPRTLKPKAPSRKQRLFQKYNGICQLCLKPVNKKDYSPDHILPKSLGGSDSFENLQLTHTWCNNIKGNDTTPRPPEYYINNELYGYKYMKMPNIRHIPKHARKD